MSDRIISLVNDVKPNQKGGVITIDGTNLEIEDVVNVARCGYSIKVSDDALNKVNDAYKITNEMAHSGQLVYGVNTGFGSLADKVIRPSDMETLSKNIIMSHAIAVGDPMPKSWVRAGILIRINALIKGHSGVSVDTINALVGLINEDITPIIPSKGSLACSGDLCLLSHMALCIAETDSDNQVLYGGQLMSSTDAFKKCGLKRTKLGPKEGLAVVNGSTFTAGIACLAYWDAVSISKIGIGSLALTLEAIGACPDAFDSNIHELRNQEGQKEVARCIRLMINGSKLIGTNGKIQDQYSLRCAPQVQGVLIDELAVMAEKLGNEINAVTDNPILVKTTNGSRFISGGNFNGEIIGHFADNLKTAIVEVGAISERRQAILLGSNMLTSDPGLNSGYMITQYTSAALCLENQHLANPSTTLSLPTCNNTEDHNSNAFNAVKQLVSIIGNVQKIISFEYLLAMRRMKKGELGKWTKTVYDKLNQYIAKTETDHNIQSEFSGILEHICLDDFVKTIDDVITQTDENERLAIPRGTRDYHPEQMVIRKQAINKIENVFIKHGAVTIDTPVFELRSTLFGKYGDNNKLVFDLNDQGGSLCSLRYDLTVPFARYLAMYNKSQMKRYHMAKVYRRDNPAMAKGRYREFMQCDLDIAGDYDLMVPDAETLCIISDILDAFDIKYTIKFNHKGLLFLLLGLCDVPEDKLLTTCSSIDKLDKMPWAYVDKELISKGLSRDVVTKINHMCQFNGSPRTILGNLQNVYQSDKAVLAILADIEILFNYCETLGCLDKLTFDTSLCRGLDYYTGIIFEAIVLEQGISVGSIAAGGRYDNLVGMFAKGRKIPAVGGSIGIERIFTILESRKNDTQSVTNTKCYVTFIRNRKDESKNQTYFNQVMKISAMLWKLNIPTEMVQDRNIIMKEQIAATLKSGIPYMIIVAEDELARGEVNIKDLINNKQESIKIDNIGSYMINHK